MIKNDVLRVLHLKKYFPLQKGLSSYLSKKGRDSVRAVDDISFNVLEKETVGFVGESGCGKSTMSRMILRLIEPTSGKIYFNDTELGSLNRKQLKATRRNMQMIFQDPHGSLNPRRTVSDILRQTVQIHKLVSGEEAEDELIRNVLEDVELGPPERFWDRYPGLLSGGQQQRVGIGRVLILKPKLLVADEPISMLDVSVRIGILDLLLKMQDKYDISFIYITHDLATARYICDRIAIMYLGKIVEIAPTEEILNHSLHPYTQALIEAVPVADPTVKVQEIPIKGFVPLIPKGFRGCRFHPRCLYAISSCREEEPELVEIGPDHAVACPVRAGQHE